MKRIFTIALVVVIGGFSAFAQENDPKLEAIIEDLGTKMEKLVVARDIDKLVGMYAENAQYLPDQGRIYNGPAEIRKVWEMVFQAEFVDFGLEADRVGGTKKLIYESGTGFSKVRFNGQEQLHKFKYVNVWERQADGNYKLLIDIFNRDLPS